MKETVIKDFSELHDLLAKYDVRTVIYRGVKSVKHPLIPKIGRVVPPDSAQSREWNEKEILRLFKEQALPYLDFMPDNDWDWLTLGQQYGLPTRLLDWTANPLVACYFAVDEPGEDDGVIYVYQNKSYIDVKKHRDPCASRCSPAGQPGGPYRMAAIQRILDAKSTCIQIYRRMAECG